MIRSVVLYETYFKDKKNGVFLEIGADDGIDKSNTKFFEDKFKPSTSPSTWKKIIPFFSKDIYPMIGKMPVNDIKGVHIN